MLFFLLTQWLQYEQNPCKYLFEVSTDESCAHVCVYHDSTELQVMIMNGLSKSVHLTHLMVHCIYNILVYSMM